MKNFAPDQLKWIRKPDKFSIQDDFISINTAPYTDLWQRTYYGFRNDNAPVLQLETTDKYFSFTVKTQFNSQKRFDQCGIALYLDSENWLKASIEYGNKHCQKLGSVVTNCGYSDWASYDIDASIKEMWYRLSRRESDYLIENSYDGIHFNQMRICHLTKGNDKISFGIYACSPENSSFTAIFSHFKLSKCQWKEHK